MLESTRSGLTFTETSDDETKRQIHVLSSQMTSAGMSLKLVVDEVTKYLQNTNGIRGFGF